MCCTDKAHFQSKELRPRAGFSSLKPSIALTVQQKKKMVHKLMIMPSAKEVDGTLITVYGTLISFMHPEIMLAKNISEWPSASSEVLFLKIYFGIMELRLRERQRGYIAQGYQGYRGKRMGIS